MLVLVLVIVILIIVVVVHVRLIVAMQAGRCAGGRRCNVCGDGRRGLGLVGIVAIGERVAHGGGRGLALVLLLLKLDLLLLVAVVQRLARVRLLVGVI